jgi:hypothetical protein
MRGIRQTNPNPLLAAESACAGFMFTKLIAFYEMTPSALESVRELTALASSV